MTKFSKAFRGVPSGEIYGRDFVPGDECPPELEDAAKSLGCLEEKKPAKKAADQK